MAGFRKAWESNEAGCLDKVMEDFKNQQQELSTTDQITEE
jgi:hypothetical protein